MSEVPTKSPKTRAKAKSKSPVPEKSQGETKVKSQSHAATRKPRLVINNISPCVDGGRYPGKAIVNQSSVISAIIFMDGHDKLAARFLWQETPRSSWRSKVMVSKGNDRWEALFTPRRTGLHRFRIEAWFDQWATYVDELKKKYHADVPVHVEIREGHLLLLAAQDSPRHHVVREAPDVTYLSEYIQAEEEYSIDEAAVVVAEAVTGLEAAEKSGNVDRSVEILLSPKLFKAMEAIEERRFCCSSDETLTIDVERTEAGFASWYELFPRSLSNDPSVHGTFYDVIEHLPRVKSMGFNVLYFPPIHPVGKRNRKGKNNNVVAQEHEPGSPYAIGSEEGGHDAVFSKLGGIEGFRALRAAAEDCGLQLALDFAIQCSPDHPWLTEHPDWFSWRPDGSIRYAENPPKKYQDIVNVNFYAASAQPAMWEAWRDIILYWISEGVTIFRVDNPHTKPLPFWEWLISDVRRRYPETIFLSEAFTRPAMMYQLAKIGFSQSYTYFIWRNSKQEITEYLTELSTTKVKDYFRPNFFVNTPDINPYFLQSSGRPGFLIRAALAATTSGLWGVYSGFELCEGEALPGKEEYLNSEKYEIRPRDFNQAGNIVEEITRLNYIRNHNPALHTHLNIRFFESHNDQVLFFCKATHDGNNILLVAISLDPHRGQEANLFVPPDLAGYGFTVFELMRGIEFRWADQGQHWYFNPHEIPFAIFQVERAS